jgi:diguanylate cyclase (GGDEF)-like protein
MLTDKDIIEIQDNAIEIAKKEKIPLLPTAYKKLFIKQAKKKGFSEEDCLNADKELAFEKLKEKSIKLKNDKINDIYVTIDKSTEQLVIYLNDGQKALNNSIEDMQDNNISEENLKRKLDSFIEQYLGLMRQVDSIKQNIDNLEDTLNKINDMNIQDPVTSFGNCKYFEMAFDGEMYTLKRYNTPVSLILLRMKNIAQVRKKYSSSVEHVIVKSLADIIHENIRASDILCRCEDEDFRILLHNTDKEKGEDFAKKIKELLNKIVFQRGNAKFKINFLYGVTQLMKKDTIEDALLRVNLRV